MEAFLASNPYFSAGFGLIGVTAGLAALRSGSLQLAHVLQRRYLVTVEIPSKDPAYNWFLKWASVHGASNAPAKKKGLLANLLVNNQLSVETQFTRRDTGTSLAQFSLVPAPGRHFIKYGPAWFHIERQRERSMLDLKTGSPWETVTVTALARDKGLLLQILDEAKTAALAEEEGKTVIYTSYGLNGGRLSVVLDEGVSEFLVKDVKAFLANGMWYHERGIPYRRGYLLYGPPGSGKTSFIQALAGHLDYNICVMNLSERGMTDDRLAHLLTNAPPRSLILLEDIDAAFTKRDASAQEGFQSMVTFSAASEERIVFMTTNHVSRLDPALIRPGRADVKMKIDDATDSQTKAMFLRFYPGREELGDKFVAALRATGRPWSAASLQGHFVIWRDSPEGAVERAEDVFGADVKE
ncbi:hypothetical protein BCR33DRAFT_718816 [Rhizoclosmatium globosum]|uniref:Mitochondrial chaperone BCS1 n=1 Tax=Rhizoclosmatium globosum TaxID=329046 RepID=A0A1Y2C456_9FUNG|nr:hypothetical protein BCR33DRAFT_718816 [Rhizoclosmatium globosum]|eukprot:ORY41677.1 hypothetical protein BCR33DRAFT_718816 [Rhizoclosmatium globosum]